MHRITAPDNSTHLPLVVFWEGALSVTTFLFLFVSAFLGGVGVASGAMPSVPAGPPGSSAAGAGIPSGTAQQPFSPPAFPGPQSAGGGGPGAPGAGAGPAGGGVTGTPSGGMMRMSDLPPLPLPPSIAGGLPNLPMGLPPPPLLFMPRPGEVTWLRWFSS